ncbi:MAG TPA: hypothetical protein VJJ22_02260 [Candidatus Paceibacterota bacterium]
MEEIKDKVWEWVLAEQGAQFEPDAEYYCPTRDIFQARLDRMTRVMLQDGGTGESHVYLLSSIAGEIGNNSFDHNIGIWPDIAGIFFSYDILGKTKQIVLADRGVGVLATLRKVKNELQNHEQALRTAFTERLSGRLPERRGNGLKFVRESVAMDHFHLSFYSGDAVAELNEQILIIKNDRSISGCLANLMYTTELELDTKKK